MNFVHGCETQLSINMSSKLAKDGKTTETLEFDELLTKYIGEIGLYQVLVFVSCIFTIWPWISGVEMIFESIESPHICVIPGIYETGNLTWNEKVLLASVLDAKDKDKSKCNYFDLDYSNLTVNDIGNILNKNTSEISKIVTEGTKECAKWEYDTRAYGETLVSEVSRCASIRA